MNTRDIIKIAI